MATRPPDDFGATLVALEAGDTLSGRYRLVRQIGRGGMGIVWLAVDTALDRETAIKLLPSPIAHDARAVARLKYEAAQSLQLSHPNICRLVNFEQDRNRNALAFLVMEYIQGTTLNDLLVEYPRGIPRPKVLKWSRQLASALDFAHAKGVLHRDIKPSNIMIDLNENAVLMDFGIAREARDTVTRITGRDSSGTLPYMSPQQVDGVNTKSNDIYSLAATLYESLKGEPPFTTGDIYQQILNKPVKPIRTQPPSINSALLKALAKSESERPASARDLARMLGSGPAAPPPASTPQMGAAPQRAPAIAKSDGPPPASQSIARADSRMHGRVRFTRGTWGMLTSVFAVLVTVLGVLWYIDASSPVDSAVLGCPAKDAWLRLKTERPAPDRWATPSNVAPPEYSKSLRSAAEGDRLLAAGQATAAKASFEQARLYWETALRLHDQGLAAQSAANSDSSGDTAVEQSSKPVPVGTPDSLDPDEPDLDTDPDELNLATLRMTAGNTHEKVSQVDSGQGLGELIDTLDVTWQEAQSAEASGDDERAATLYQTINEQGTRLLAADQARAAALAVHQAWLHAWEGRPEVPYTAIKEELSEFPAAIAAAQEQFDAGRFADATSRWRDALDRLAVLLAQHEDAQHDMSNAQAAYERAMTEVAPLLCVTTEAVAAEREQVAALASRARGVSDIGAFDIASQAYRDATSALALAMEVHELVLQECLRVGQECVEEGRFEQAEASLKPCRYCEQSEALLIALYVLWYDSAVVRLDEAEAQHALLQLETIAPNRNETRERRAKFDAGAWPRHGDRYQAPRSGIDLVYIEPGEFNMGSPTSEDGRDDDESVHVARITTGFYIATTEVTQEQFERISRHSLTYQRDKHSGDHIYEEGPLYPMYYVSWEEANEFCEALSRLERRRFRLPTEAEWEYACRAGTDTRFNWGDSEYPPNVSVAMSPFALTVAKVGTTSPNPWGIYDMHGNVSEWCSDFYAADFYQKSPTEDPRGPLDGRFRVIRGGSFVQSANECRSASRAPWRPTQGLASLGFRVVMEP